MRDEGGCANRREYQARPRTHVSIDTAKAKRIGLHVLSKGKECPDDIRQASGIHAQICRKAFLGKRILLLIIPISA